MTKSKEITLTRRYEYMDKLERSKILEDPGSACRVERKLEVMGDLDATPSGHG